MSHAATAAFVLACAHGGVAPATTSSDIITRAELSRTSASTAYEAIQRLRPQFFKDRGRTSILRPESRTPVVILDERPLGDISFLRDISLNTVYEIRYLTASEAQVKFGSGYPAGAIVVITAKTSLPRA
ncbi:MAG: hypothetical protein U0163_12225 [Gemmatimonadaceae bacterium]